MTINQLEPQAVAEITVQETIKNKNEEIYQLKKKINELTLLLECLEDSYNPIMEYALKELSTKPSMAFTDWIKELSLHHGFEYRESQFTYGTDAVQINTYENTLDMNSILYEDYIGEHQCVNMEIVDGVLHITALGMLCGESIASFLSYRTFDDEVLIRSRGIAKQ